MNPGKLGELLVAKGLITHDQLTKANEHRAQTKGRVLSSLVKLGHVNENVLVTFLSKHYGIPAVSLDEVKVPEDLVRLVPVGLCEKHLLIPIGLDGTKLTIAVADPTNVAAVDDVRFLCNRDVNVYLATESSIRGLLERVYLSAGAQIDAGVNELIAAEEEKERDEKKAGSTTLDFGGGETAMNVETERGGDKPVIKLLNKVFVEAIRRKVSDIHIEPYEDHSRIRFRIDGSLHEVMKAPPQLKPAIPARIKVMSKLDISEKRLPQDGRIQVKTGEKKIDIRVSILPTVFGEKVVMRLLDQGGSPPSLMKIGFEEEQFKVFKKAATQPYGMILVTGPTGSGKSTTLFAALNELNSPDVNISTAEDPVEYNMAGVNQTQMKEGIGLTFAAALRSLLRQDPDIVMVGEIRDMETAEISVKAALTGHLVFSTLHTNDAPSTISRLLHMGLEPFLITAALTLVQAQRLVRMICEKCRQPDPKVTEEMMLDAEVPQNWIGTFQPMRGVGCDRCGGTGYKGRKGIFEVMYMTETLRDMVVKGENADQIKKQAITEGLITLRRSGLLKLYRGDTTLEEVLGNSRPDGDLIK